MAWAFPVTPHISGRYLVDAHGVPFPIVGDSAWQIANEVTVANAQQYLADIVSKGFTTAIVQLITLGSSAPKTDVNGDLPFLKNNTGGTYDGTPGTADFSTPNDTYWSFVRTMIDAFAAWNILVIAYCDFLGFDGDGTQGMYPDFALAINTNTVCTNFGTYLGSGNGTFKGFGNYANLIFADGGDYGASSSTPPSAAVETKMTNLLTAMQAAGATSLRYFDGNAPSAGTDESAFTQYQQVQGCYTYGGTFPGASTFNLRNYAEARLSFNFVPTLASQGPHGAGSAPLALPTFLKETAYEFSTLTSPAATPAMVRKAQHWAWLSGCIAGIVTGDDHVWPFTNGTWQTALNDTSRLDMQRWGILLSTIAWWKLIPSELAGTRLLVTSANGSQAGAPSNYVAAAQAYDGTFIVAFFPDDGTTNTQNATFDLRSMITKSKARWWDPTNNTYTQASNGLYNVTSTNGQSFTTPGANSANNNDWILLIETPSPPASSWTWFAD